MGLAGVVWGSTLVAAAAVIGHAAVRTADGAEVDRELFTAVNAGHGPAADRLFTGVTELGSIAAPATAAALLTLAGRRRAAAHGMAAAGVTWLALQGVKKLVDRPRPGDADPTGTRALVARPKATSWPSSHPAVLSAFTRVAGRTLGVGRGGRAALSTLDLTVAASRVYVGVHYPSDVASGLLLGRAIARMWPRGRR